MAERDAVRARPCTRPGVRLPPLAGRTDARLRRNTEEYAEQHDLRGMMADLAQSVMVNMPQDPRAFLAAELARRRPPPSGRDRDDAGALPRNADAHV